MSNTEALRAAAEQALDAMNYSGMDVGKFNRINAACRALREALAASTHPADVSKSGAQIDMAASVEPVEPFGYVITHNFPEGHAYRYSFYTPKSIGTAYLDTALSITSVFATAPPAPALVPLTDAQIQAAWDSVDMRHPRGDATRNAFARAIERAVRRQYE